MPVNFYMYFVIALVPLVTGAIYYHPAVFGNAWMRTNNFTEESLKGGNMAVILGVTYIFSVLLAFILPSLTIHQTQVASIFMPELMDANKETPQILIDLMDQYGNRYRDFKHGVIHGSITAFFIGLPILGINALFERRGWKYIGIHLLYWFITLAIMGGITCATLKFPPLS